MIEGHIVMWVVYERPTDFPDHCVARCHLINGRGTFPTDMLIQAETLEALRQTLHENGLTCLKRHPQDEPQIVETWL
jgi:hypothetical protein